MSHQNPTATDDGVRWDCCVAEMKQPGKSRLETYVWLDIVGCGGGQEDTAKVGSGFCIFRGWLLGAYIGGIMME